MSSDTSSSYLIEPEWPAPANVHAIITTRRSGFSLGSYASMNLGDHVGDAVESVAKNRALFAEQAGLATSSMAWLKQVHGTDIVDLDASPSDVEAGQRIEADGSTTLCPHQGCVILTADCMPVLLCDHEGSRVAAVHAGWRGMAAGVIEQALGYFPNPESVMAYLGPTISQRHFEVGSEVKAAFEAKNSVLGSAFVASRNAGKYMGDLYAIARSVMEIQGVCSVFGGDFCTYEQADLFHSFRRDGAQSGRMASLIYIDTHS